MSPDPYDPSNDEIVKRQFDEYEMPVHDKQSIKEIQKKIESKGYKDLAQITKHQDFLEDMCNRLRSILQSEKNIGEINWELERQIEDVKRLYFELEKIRKEQLKK